MGKILSTTKGLVLATVCGVLILLQFTLLTAALDFVTSIMLIGVGFAAGYSTKST
jgi:hypothetical protein